MKAILRTISIVALVLGLTVATQAQSEKVIAKAAEKVETLNAKIVKGDATLELSEEQKVQATDIYAKMLVDIRKAKKGTADEDAKQEQVKAIRKAAGKKISMEVLTKAQRQARKAAKNQ